MPVLFVSIYRNSTEIYSRISAMKNNYALPALCCLLFAIISCKKENKTGTANNAVDQALVGGKWQEIKARAYSQDQTGTITNDTTYLAAAFTNLDYVQFFDNDTCVIATDYYYLPAAQQSAFAGQVNTVKFKYAVAGNVFLINQPSINYGGFTTTDTATVSDQHHLFTHAVTRPPVGTDKLIADAWYTR